MEKLWLKYFKIARNSYFHLRDEKKNAVAFMNMYETLSNFKDINIKFYSIGKLFGSY